MWIANCVFQGAGLNGRAIATSNGGPTGNGRTPALYIQSMLPSCKVSLDFRVLP